MVLGVALALSVQSLLTDLGLAVDVEGHVDSTTAKSLTDRIGVNSTKHIEIRFLWTQERVQRGDLKVKHVRTNGKFC